MAGCGHRSIVGGWIRSLRSYLRVIKRVFIWRCMALAKLPCGHINLLDFASFLPWSRSAPLTAAAYRAYVAPTGWVRLTLQATEKERGAGMRAFKPVRIAGLGPRADMSGRVVVSEAAVPARPLHFGARMLDAFGLQDDWLPLGIGTVPPYSSWVFTISDAILLSSSGIVALSGGEVLEDTLDHTLPQLDGYGRSESGMVLIPEPITYDSGRFLSLLLGAHDNHFHWMIMSLARAALLTPDDLQGLDGILVPAGLAGAQLEALELSGLSLHAPLRFMRRGETLQVRRLLLPWNIAGGAGVNSVGAAWLHELVRGGAAQALQRRVYLDRRAASTRRLTNEAELVDALVSQGVQPVRLEDLSLAKQAHLMRQADLIIAPHGAGLANLAFAQPGTRVLELMPSATLNWCYRHLAAVCGLQYDCVLGRSQGLSAWAPWVISPTHVLSALAEMESIPS